MCVCVGGGGGGGYLNAVEVLDIETLVWSNSKFLTLTPAGHLQPSLGLVSRARRSEGGGGTSGD